MKNSQLKVVTSCRSRFHIFDQARELARHQMLHYLITDYPKSRPARFGIPPEKVNSQLLTGIINHGMSYAYKGLPEAIRGKLQRWIHDNFSRRLARLIPDDTAFFIGLSSFCLEGLVGCREMGITCAVDHGSLHLNEDTRLVEEEARRWSVSVPRNVTPKWIIDKENREFKVADHVFTLSTTARDSMVRNGVLPEKIFVNPCGVDLSDFKPGKKNDGIFRIIQVGAIKVGKGVLTLLDAFNRFAKSDAELWFVGAGIEVSGIENEIRKMCGKKVSFFSPVPQKKLADYYNASSVFVLASVADGFGMVVAQAMACGLPVIVTENVGAKDLVDEGKNGFIVPVGSPDIIAERLSQLHENPELCLKMGIAARKKVEEGYSWIDYGNRLSVHIANTVSKL